MTRRRPHDAPAGPNPTIRNLTVEVLADHWYTLRRATFDQLQPDGTWQTQQREAYDRGNGAVALLHDPSRDTILLVRQYRAPAHLNEHPDGMLLEAPAGLLDAGENAVDAMRRELEEEVGHHIARLTKLWTLYMSPGSVTEHVTFFIGTYDDSTHTGAGGGVDHEHERIDIVEMTLDDAAAAIATGAIVDAKTVLLIQHLRADPLRPRA